MVSKEEIEGAKERISKSLEDICFATLYSQEENDKDEKTLLQYIEELEISNTELDKENNRLEKIEFERDEANNKIKKLKDKLKKDIKFFDKTKKLHETYSPSEERLNAKQHYAEEILEIMGEK